MPKPRTDAPAYEPETVYNVRLTRVVVVGRLKLLPRNAHELTGAALNGIVAAGGADAIESATPKGA